MARGALRIYLGAAPGVGKTYAMLQEGRRRAERGADVVIGVVETHGRRYTAEQVQDLEIVPRREVGYRGTTLEEMDVDAILERRPQICLVDELAHTNAPGSRNAKRYEDVEELLAAGIDVISTVNIQHLESLNDVVERITGAPQREIIPDALVRAADQVHLVDQTPEALRRRMVHGNIYGTERAEAALANYFRVGNLSALRELALMWVADQVDDGLQSYRERHGISEGWETRERIVVAVTGAPTSDDVIRRASRIATRLRGELIGVRVRPTDGLSSDAGEGLETQKMLLSALGARYREVASSDVGRALVEVARAENATQIVIGSSHRSRWAELTSGSVVNDVTRHSGSIDVHIISTSPTNGPGAPPSKPRRRRRTVALSRRRRSIAWALAVVIPVVLTALLRLADDRLGFASDLLVFLTGSVAVATIGGLPPAAFSAVASSLLLNWYFTDPVRTLTIAEPENLLALVVFVLVAGLVGSLVSRAARRSAEAARARGDAESLAAMAALTSTTDDPLPLMVGQVRSALGAAGVAVQRRADGRWETIASDGHVEPLDDRASTGGASGRVPGAAISAPIDESTHLAVYGEGFGDGDIGVLAAFSSQITTLLDQQRLRREAALADQLVEVNELRASLLAAVSHDLRTPLAAIKASASSLRQTDIDWPQSVRDEFLATIEAQTDRLTELVSNLLGMSRIQSGAVSLTRRPVGVDDVVSAALAGIDCRGIDVVVEVDVDTPMWDVDPALAERVVANLVDNAVKWSPPGRPVRVVASSEPPGVTLRIIDHGPGIPLDRRDEVFEPFQRLGDGTVGGTGLGLAVARGLTNVLGGRLRIDDTPGGGTTMELTLDAANADPATVGP